jgi:hypothetical protein
LEEEFETRDMNPMEFAFTVYSAYNQQLLTVFMFSSNSLSHITVAGIVIKPSPEMYP